MGQRRKVWAGVAVSIGAVALLAGGPVLVLSAERSTSLDDPTGTITDTVDTLTDTVNDPTGTITDTVDSVTDTVTDTVDDPTSTITDTIDDAVEDTADTVDDAVEDPVDAADDSLDGTTDTVEGAPADTSGPIVGGSESADPDAAARAPGDLDEIAEGGNDVVEGEGGAVCTDAANVVCVGLVGGLGPVGALFPAAEGAHGVVDAFVDALARTGIDLLGALVAIVALTLVGVVLRRSTSRPAGSRRFLTKA
jgi:hypothetical protein